MQVNRDAWHYRVYDWAESHWGQLVEADRSKRYDRRPYVRPPLNLCAYMRAILLKPLVIPCWRLALKAWPWQKIGIAFGVLAFAGLIAMFQDVFHQNGYSHEGGVLLSAASLTAFGIAFASAGFAIGELEGRNDQRHWLLKILYSLPGLPLTLIFLFLFFAIIRPIVWLIYGIVSIVLKLPRPKRLQEKSAGILRLLFQWISDRHKGVCRPIKAA